MKRIQELPRRWTKAGRTALELLAALAILLGAVAAPLLASSGAAHAGVVGASTAQREGTPRPGDGPPAGSIVPAGSKSGIAGGLGKN